MVISLIFPRKFSPPVSSGPPYLQVDAMDVTGEAAYTEILHASKQEMDATVKKLERARAVRFYRTWQQLEI